MGKKIQEIIIENQLQGANERATMILKCQLPEEDLTNLDTSWAQGIYKIK